MKNRDRIDILGSLISVYDLRETADRIFELATGTGKHYVCISNVHTVVMGLEDPAFQKVTNDATLATPDGMPLVWASGFLDGVKIHGRASGPDIMELLLRDSKYSSLGHYFYGSTPQVLKGLEKNLRVRYPNAKLSGFFSPPKRDAQTPSTPLSKDEIQDCMTIDQSKPHLVWVGLGAPKQEVWMARARSTIQAPVLLGVGAAFDFHAGTKKRAPKWMQKTGMEWLHRMMSEPDRLIARYMGTNPVFVKEVLKAWAQQKFQNERK